MNPLSLLKHTGAASLCLALVTFVDAQTLTHRYSFNDPSGNSTFVDSVGGPSWDGTLVSTASLDGSQLQLDGNSWATLPPGIISNYTQVTVEFWASFGPGNPVWTRVFAFGDQTAGGGENSGIDYCHYAGGNWQNLNISYPGAGAYANNPIGLEGQTNVHVTAVVDPPSGKLFYYNGVTIPSGLNGIVPPLSGVVDSLNLIGRSLWDQDAPLIGSINEFRIYQGAITPAQVAVNDAAGPNNYVSDPGILLAVHLTSPNNPILVNQNSAQIFTGDFANVTGVNLGVYGGATFTSGNTAVFAVDSSGVVKGVSPGTTTLVASFGGLSATNTLTVTAVPAVLTHRYSFSANANDSVGNANGSLIGNASVSSGKVVLDGNSSYVDLPGGLINIATNNAVTIDTWVDFGESQTWARLFDFGADGGSAEFWFGPRTFGNGGEHTLSENFTGGLTINWPGTLTNTSTHLTCVVDPPTASLAIYRDGVLEMARYDTSGSLSSVATNLAVLGRSLVAVDPYLVGSIDEFRIYNGALTAQEIALDHQNGPDSLSHDPGALVSIRWGTNAYPAYSSMVPPVVLANYANLANFNLLPNNSARVGGLILTSSDTNVLEVTANNMLRTHRPGSVTLAATYQGKTDTITATVQNMGRLTHRYSFTADANDSVGIANATLQGTAALSSGSLVLDGNFGSYVELPPGMLQGYDAATVDAWVTFNTAQTWARLWYFGNDRADEFYVAPSVNGGDAHWFSTGFPFGGSTITISPRWENETLHVTCVYGNGTIEYYTNGVLHGSLDNLSGRMAEVGNWFSWIGRSPYPADPYVNCSIDEFRIYRGRLAPDEIQAADAIGPDQLLATTSPLVTASHSGGGLVLSWPSSSAGFSVQAAPALQGTWSTLTNAPTLVGGTWQVTVPASGTSRYLRLWR